MKFKAQLHKFEGQLWGHHILIPHTLLEDFLKENSRRVLLSISGNKPFACALMPNGKGDWFINLNKEIRVKYNLQIGTELEAELQADLSKYGIPLPEEMEELLLLDEEGSAFFHALTPGKQRSLLHLVGKPKNSDTRLRKAIVIIDYLKEVEGKLDFKELHHAFKNAPK